LVLCNSFKKKRLKKNKGYFLNQMKKTSSAPRNNTILANDLQVST